jgi:hypothetical protein
MYGMFKNIVKLDCTKSIVIKCKLYRFKVKFGTGMTTEAVLLVIVFRIGAVRLRLFCTFRWIKKPKLARNIGTIKPLNIAKKYPSMSKENI